MNTMDVTSVLKTLEMMAALEMVLAEYYQACGERWPEDGKFWFHLSGEERQHAQYMTKISELLSRKPKVFERGRPLNITAINTATTGVQESMQKVRNGELTKQQILFRSRDLEQSILESKYTELLKTADIESNTLFAEITSQTEAHRKLFKQRIEEA